MSLRVLSSLTRSLTVNSTNVRFMCFKSGLSIDKIYPNSVDIKPFKPPESTDGKFTGYIPVKSLEITSMRASGPGGQHVNKAETKVDIRFHVESADWLSNETKQKLISKYYTRMNKDGYFIIRSEKTRSKLLNIADALKYLRELIFQLEEPNKEPKPESLEKRRKNQEKANRIRLMEKKMRSLKLQSKQL